MGMFPLIHFLLFSLGFASRNGEEDLCTIETTTLEELSMDMLQHFIASARPLMVRGGLMQANWHNYTIDGFLDTYGQADATTGKQDRFAYAWWPPVRGAGSTTTTVKSFVTAMLEEGRSSKSIYRQTMQIIFSAVTRRAEDFQTPEPFSELCTDSLYEPPQLNIGVLGTGAPPHHHRQIWNGLLRGRKQWFLGGQQDYNRTVGMTAREWLESSGGPSKLVSKGVDTCIQEAGDVLFVPHATLHATFNLAECIAVAQAFCHKGSSRSLMPSYTSNSSNTQQQEAQQKSSEQGEDENEDDDGDLPDFHQQMMAYKLPSVEVSVTESVVQSRKEDLRR
ncbi:bifunctional arginine demethylase and lysyl-hydroxylase [bacterium]|nr:bifunctional arginine demethylase and lysyl-hydroxylase [bacterium]